MFVFAPHARAHGLRARHRQSARRASGRRAQWNSLPHIGRTRQCRAVAAASGTPAAAATAAGVASTATLDRHKRQQKNYYVMAEMRRSEKVRAKVRSKQCCSRRFASHLYAARGLRSSRSLIRMINVCVPLACLLGRPRSKPAADRQANRSTTHSSGGKVATSPDRQPDDTACCASPPMARELGTRRAHSRQRRQRQPTGSSVSID